MVYNGKVMVCQVLMATTTKMNVYWDITMGRRIKHSDDSEELVT
jgi:hypothetical protein